ncbi:SH3 domain-containing protein [Niabella drilacis]|uniref:SH3 domain-containing protein n=2 Tax=Niabella drilacis (strain DSM 25811 / CCM 8410 / CCUG 62505 / LMG 26954 / E90) TaxID=1285928 RepID=A0A1G6QU88_NIADE|nr:SH3 domain-containing protein [Niabella drilacis]
MHAQSDTLGLFEKQQEVYALADSVNIRTAPSLAAESIGLISVGTPMIITGISPVALQLNGVIFPWYKVACSNGKSGFIWGGKLAMASFRSHKNPDISFHYGVERVTDSNIVLQIRVVKNAKELQRISFTGLGNRSPRLYSCRNLSNKGLKNVDDIIEVQGGSEACGEAGGTLTFFWADQQLHFVRRQFDTPDGEYFDRTYFIYPSDMQGIKDLIIEKHEEGSILFEEGQKVASWDSNNVKYGTNKAEKYRWTGEKLVPTL